MSGVDFGVLHSRWYGMPVVRNELYRGLKGRFMSLRIPVDEKKWRAVRYVKLSSPDLLERVLVHWGAWGVKHKLYFDLARLSRVPLFSYNVEERAVQKEDFDGKLFWELFEGLDFAVDVDAVGHGKVKGKWEGTRKKAVKVRDWLDKQNFKYSVWNSSDNGFQFWVKGERLPGEGVEDMVRAHIKLARRLERGAGVKVDSSVYDSRRFIKLPYSLCEDTVVLPLSDSMLDVWSPEVSSLDEVLRNVWVKDRGWLVRDGV